MAAIDYAVKCPKCGSGMVLRTATKGQYSGKQFYGCSRFPKCKGIRNQDAISNPSLAIKEKPESQTPEHEKNPFLAAQKIESPKSKSKVKGTPLTDLQKKELAILRDRLLNVSSRNRSIRLSRLDKKSAFDLSLLNGFDPELVNNLIEHCLSQESEVPILPSKDFKNEKLWDELSSRLVHLHRNISEIHKEKGLYDLYIGFPFLTGKPSGSETLIQAPIFLIPVHLEKSFPKKGMPVWTLKASSDSKVLFNKTLFYALSKLCNLTVNQDIFDEDVPTELYGDQHFIERTHKLLQNYGVISKINEDALDTEFDKVREFSTTTPPEDLSRGGLEICQYGVLGHFPQSNSSLQKDYEAFLGMSQEDLESITCFLSEEYLYQEQEFDESSLDSSFDFSSSAESNESATIDQRSEKDNFFLLQSDSSQDRILLSLSKPSTDGLVVWGPPGTGKSQTIVNVIADCIANGKTVLLVSQKRAALDVVYERLATRNMESLAALVHDTKEDRRDLYRKISSICTQEMPSSIHVIDPTSEIEAITSTLKEVTLAYNDNQFGRKSGLIFQETASFKGSPIEGLDHKWMQTKSDELNQICHTLDSYQNLYRPNLPQDLQEGRRDFAKLDYEIIASLKRLAAKFQSPEIQYAKDVFAILSGQKIAITEKLVNFERLYLSICEDDRFSKFFQLKYWKLRSKFRKEVAAATSILSNLSSESRKVLGYFFNDSIISTVDFLRTPDSSGEVIQTASAIVGTHFDALKALDLYRSKLPKEVQELESKLSPIVSDRRHTWGKTFKNAVYSLWAREIEKRHPVISAIRSGQIDQLRNRLKILLDQKIDYCIALLQKRVRSTLSSDSGKQFSRSVAVEVERKRNILPIRKLNDKFIASGYFKSMLPVWLVSPETVSDVFPLTKGLFDVVIFDEASQCTVENGLPAIFRGKQIVIAGDEKQLPPSRLFESTVDEENDDESFASNEPSLLTLAKKTLKYQSMMLEWHYRSKHQELVTFSNEVFYGGRMKIAPNVIPFVKGNKPAIEWHPVNGYWQERTNHEEAQRVLEMVEDYLQQDVPPSLGVITFNVNQKNYILDLIDKRTQESPAFAVLMEGNRKLPLDEQLFVKNIENVQGDERDVIIFTTAYAPAHPGGRVQQHFGLLNQPGGENRLNVAVTRAISRIHVISSINPEIDLNTSTSMHSGPKIFHKYLCYAKAVADGNFERIESILKELNPNLSVRPEYGHVNFDSPFEEDVFNELSMRGYEVHSQVGQSGFRIDLAIVHPNDPSRYILGIECDGAMYHSSVSVRERDVFRQRFLESRGWVISRIWSPSWRESRQREIQKIVAKIDEILREQVEDSKTS